MWVAAYKAPCASLTLSPEDSAKSLSLGVYVLSTIAPFIEEIRQARKRRIVITMYAVYGDESHDSKEKEIYVVDGLIGSQEQWDEFETKWKERTGGRIFHASDCESDRGDFKNSSHGDNLKLYKDLTRILAESGFIGYAAAIDINAYNNAFPNIVNGYSYLLCFRIVIEHFGNLAGILIPRDRLKFNFHINPQIEHTAATMYQLYRDNDELKYAPYLDEISYVSMKYPGIQAADLFARETLKWAKQGMPLNKLKIRKSLARLVETGRFKMEFFVEEYFQDFKNKLPEIEAIAGLTQKDYEQWLLEEGIKHNASNSTRYLAHVYDMERKRKQKKQNQP